MNRKKTCMIGLRLNLQEDRSVMRLRNIPGAKDAILESGYVVQEPKEHKGCLLYTSDAADE